MFGGVDEALQTTVPKSTITFDEPVTMVLFEVLNNPVTFAIDTLSIKNGVTGDDGSVNTS